MSEMDKLNADDNTNTTEHPVSETPRATIADTGEHDSHDGGDTGSPNPPPTDKEKEKLPLSSPVLSTSKDSLGDECPICFWPLKQGDRVLLACKHEFCSRCLASYLYLYSKYECPICREPIQMTEEDLMHIITLTSLTQVPPPARSPPPPDDGSDDEALLLHGDRYSQPGSGGDDDVEEGARHRGVLRKCRDDVCDSPCTYCVLLVIIIAWISLIVYSKDAK